MKKEELQKEKRKLIEWLNKVNSQNPNYDDGFLKNWIKDKIKEIDRELKK
jgi:hypothetical protein